MYTIATDHELLDADPLKDRSTVDGLGSPRLAFDSCKVFVVELEYLHDCLPALRNSEKHSKYWPSDELMQMPLPTVKG